ncbi:MAG: hypothetical protein ABI479_03070 [Gallionella sp.]
MRRAPISLVLTQPRQHPAEIEITRLHQVGLRLGIHEIKFSSAQLGEIPTQAFGVGYDALRGFLNSDKDIRLHAILCAIHQKLQRKYGLAATRSADQQHGAAAWQSSAGDFIETGDAGRGLGSVRLITGVVCAVTHIICRRAQLPE